MTKQNNANESNVVLSSSNEPVSNVETSEVTAETKEMKVVKTLTFEAYMEGLERNDYRPWSSSSTIDHVKLDRVLIPALTKHMYELSKLLGEVVPLNVKDKTLPKGIEILDGDSAQVYPEAMVMSVMVKLNFVKFNENLTSEDIAYTIKELGKIITPDEQLVALSIGDDSFPVPAEGTNVFKGVVEETYWFPYIRNGERRNMYSSKTDENGNIVFEDTGIQFFPQKSAWKFLDDKKRIVGNTKMLEYIKSYHEKSKQIEEYENSKTVRMVAAKGGFRNNKFINKKRDYDKQPPTKPEQARKDSLGSLGDNLKPTNNKARVWLKNQKVSK